MKIEAIPTWKIKAILDDPYCRGIDGADYEPYKEDLYNELRIRENRQALKEEKSIYLCKDEPTKRTAIALTDDEKEMIQNIAAHKNCSMNHVLNELALKSFTADLEQTKTVSTNIVQIRLKKSMHDELTNLAKNKQMSIKEIIMQTFEQEYM